MSIDLDISLAHPWSSEVFPSSSKIDGLASKRREEKKKNQVSRRKATNWQPNNLEALVIEHFGRWGDEEEQYFRTLGSQSLTEMVGVTQHNL